MTDSPIALLSLLQIASATLPVGAYSYSEGLEFAIESGPIASSAALADWLRRELRGGSVRIDSAVMLRAYRAVLLEDRAAIAHWNSWLGAMRETAELRQQSEQMGRALADLLQSLDSSIEPWLTATQSDANDANTGRALHFAIGFGIAAARSQIDERSVAIGFLQSWATNAIGAGIKLIPLGQTDGQRLLRQLDDAIAEAAEFAVKAKDEDLETSGWGLGLASMQHETQRVRLFRS